jgi:glycosyltransferase involved in cell wall biosynthesis
VSLKILLIANSPLVYSGYGQATYYLIKIFQKLHHEVAVFAYFGAEVKHKWEGIDIYPRGFDPYGNDVAEAHAASFGADLVITNMDVWVLNSFGSKQFNWLPMVPVAEDPLTLGNSHALQGAVKIVAISKYGQRTLSDAGFPSTHIYLPIPTDFFHPVNKEKCKAAFHWGPDTYVIGHVGMNRGYRKGHDILLQAFRIFLSEHHNSLLYMHTDMRSHDGIGLQELANALGIAGKVVFPSRYDANFGWPITKMLGLYNAFDLYVQPSTNEGQAMPVWEASSVGCPVVATNATAITEAIEGADAIPVEPTNRIWNHNDALGYEVTVDDLANAMLDARRKWGIGYVSAKSRQWAIENVSVDVITQKWQDELLEVEKIVRFQPVIKPWKVKPRIVQVSTRIHNCGIGAYTRALMAAMEGSTTQECVDIMSLKNADQIPDCDIVHLHYESAISPTDAILREVLVSLRMREIPVVTTYHTVLPQIANEHITNGLVSMAVIHWPPPGVQTEDKRVWILGGMGCPSYHIPRIEKRGEIRENYGFSTKDIIITTFGFAAVGRGHFEVLEQLAPMLQTNHNVKIQLIVAANFLNEEGKNIVHSRVEEITKAYHIGQQVHLIPEFVSDLEVLNRLWMSDVGFLFIGFNTASCSAAVRFFISARLPLIVNSSTHFADIMRGIVKVEGFNLSDFSKTVWDSAFDQELQVRLKKEHEITYESQVWRQFSEQYLSIYKRVLGG